MMKNSDNGWVSPRRLLRHALVEELGMADLDRGAAKGLTITVMDHPGEPLRQLLGYEDGDAGQNSLFALVNSGGEAFCEDFVLILRSEEWTQIIEVDPFWIGDDEPLLLVSRDRTQAFCWQPNFGIIPCLVPVDADSALGIMRGQVRITASMLAFSQFPHLVAA